ncbi:MAG TPA: gliding motility-associated C-terminal domain-containing protein, partial [Flavobacterium sp.]|uniref:DUF7507 domain-containing protein n=1 Tax=Flavobacterium sp. TaxID=239 RepID=UPI002DBD4CF5
TVTLTLTVTSNNACGSATATSTYAVNVDPLPQASANGGSQTICSNASATVSGATASNGSISWTHNGAGSLSNETTLTPTYTATAADEGKTVTLTLTVTSNNACGLATATSTYTVNVDPTLKISGILSVCVNSSTQLTGSATAAASDAWVSSNSSIATVSSTGMVTGVNNGTTVITFTNNIGCQTTTTITVNELPDLPISGGDITECMNSSIQTLTAIANVPEGQSIDWYTSISGGTIVQNPTHNTVGSITYYAQAINNITSCLSSSRTPVVLTINSCSITVTKDGTYQDTNKDGITNVGDKIIYNFVVTNTSNITLTDIKITDINANVLGGPIASLAPGASDSDTFTAFHEITQKDIDTRVVYNLATVTGTPPTGSNVTDTSSDPTPCTTCPIDPICPDCTITPLTQSPEITVVKTAITTSYNTVGDVINYTIKIKNTGNVTLHQIIVKDPLTGLDTIIEELTPGASSDYTQSYTVTQDDLNNGSVTNIATADGLTPNNTPISAKDDEIVNENANPIDAFNDNAGIIVGVNQITANVINVFTNDKLNGAAVNQADVILTTVTSNPFLQMNANGSIDVLPNAPVGTQTLIYQICEKLNSTNCDSATVTVTIEAPSMTVSGEGICINDVPYFSYSTTANNFTPINGLTLTWTDSNNNVVATMANLPLNGKVLWPGATVDQNGNGTDWPGWLLVDGKWIEGPDGFENLRPTASITFTLNPSQTIVVNYPPSDPFCTSRPTFKIDAVNDTASTLEGLNGVKNVINVFTNDTLNTEVLNPADVKLTVLIPDPQGGIILNTNGTVDVKPNTPTGTYTLTYQICEIADAGNCDSAIVTINVTKIPLPIQATPDLFSVDQCSIVDAIRNALSNDLLNGSPANISDFKFKLLSAIGQNINIDENGNVTFVNGVAAGQYVFDYQVCEAANPTNCATSTITINVAGIEPVTIAVSPEKFPCNDDTTKVNLSDFLPEGTPSGGTWIDIDTNHTGALEGSFLNPFGVAVGIYHFEYKITGNCPRSIILEMGINAKCNVLPCETLVVHNAFSPNEDSHNDFFKIDNVENNDCFKNVKVEIFNRWGVLVFEKENYNDSNAFRGRSEGRTTINKNEGLPTGTYFYILSYDAIDSLGNTQKIKKDGYLYLAK